MSELWTPEQPKETPTGGIELPTGFARRRDQTPPPAEPASEAAQPPAAAAAQPGAPAAPQPRQEARSQFLFPPSGVQIQCPNCATPFVAPVFSIIDYGANPELRVALLSSQINVAACSNCGFTAPLSVPLLVHDPEHQFLGAYVPMQARMDDRQRQRVIGDLTKTLMARIPQEQRRGYMLQTQQFLDWERLLEKLWGFEGVTPEMLRRQREQGNLVQSLLKLVGDESALKLVVERNQALIDQEFFALFPQVANAYAAQGRREEAAKLSQLYEQLVETTPAGAEIKQQRAVVDAVLRKFTPNMSREQMADIVAEAWQGPYGEQVVTTLAAAARPLFDYAFVLALAEQIERTTDEKRKESLKALRTFIVALQQQQRQAESAMAQQATAMLQEVLEAADPRALLQEYAEELDNTFFAVLAANIQNAEKNGAKAALGRLRQIHQLAVSVMEERMPADMRLLNQLLNAPDDAVTRKILQENRNLLTKEFAGALHSLEQEWRADGRTEMADRAKSVRGRVALMM